MCFLQDILHSTEIQLFLHTHFGVNLWKVILEMPFFLRTLEFKIFRDDMSRNTSSLQHKQVRRKDCVGVNTHIFRGRNRSLDGFASIIKV